MLNIIWAGFFILAVLVAFVESFNGNTQVWSLLAESLFTNAEQGFKIAINLTGILCFWLGMMRIAEKSGLTEILAKILKPLFYKIMPEVPKNSSAFGSITMNIAANVLGLDNAATPMGLKAMEQLQDVNTVKDKASNAQILFMVINSSSVTLIPITILMYRYQFGSINPTAVFIPILLATSISTLVGFFATACWQRLNIFNPVVLIYLSLYIVFIGVTTLLFTELPPENRIVFSNVISNGILIGLVIVFLISGLVKKQNVYEEFIDGAKDGFKIAVQIIPYLIAMLVAIGVFRTSGGLEWICEGIASIFNYFNINTDFVNALPTAFMKPLSGSAARAMMLDSFATYGVDSFVGFTTSVIQGSTETTFYVLAVYFGAIKISKTGAALPLALIADAAGIIAAIYLSYLFY